MNPRRTFLESTHQCTPKVRLASCLWLLTSLALVGTWQAVAACDHPPEEQVQAERSRSLTPAQIVSNPDLVHDRLREKNQDYRNQAQFAVDPALGLVGDLSDCGITDLSPLQGIPFGALDLKGLEVADLAPLKGMPLVLLGLEDTQQAVQVEGELFDGADGLVEAERRLGGVGSGAGRAASPPGLDVRGLSRLTRCDWSFALRLLQAADPRGDCIRRR